MALACSSPQPERVGNLPISSLKHLARRAVIHVLQETLTLTSAKLTDAFARGQDSGFQREVTPRQAGGYPAGLDEEGRAHLVPNWTKVGADCISLGQAPHIQACDFCCCSFATQNTHKHISIFAFFVSKTTVSTPRIAISRRTRQRSSRPFSSADPKHPSSVRKPLLHLRLSTVKPCALGAVSVRNGLHAAIQPSE